VEPKIGEELPCNRIGQANNHPETFRQDNLLDKFSRKDRFEYYYASFLATEKKLIKDNIMNQIPQGMILNVGCGSIGTERRLFPTSGYEIFGADVNVESLKILQRKKLYNAVYNASISSLPFAQGTFDIVYLRLVLHHLVYPENILVKGLEECFRVLKPGGLLALVEPNSWHPIGALMNIAHTFGIDMYIHGTDDDVALSPRMLHKILSQYGKDISIYVVSYSWRRLPIACQICVDFVHSVLKNLTGKMPYFGHTLMMLAHKD
jgi:SAM-dependent methyltransferase